MTLLVSWVAACGLVAWLLRRRPVAICGIAVALSTFIPAVAAYRFTGERAGLLATHPAVWLLLVAAAVQVVCDPHRLSRALARHSTVALVTLTFVVGAFMTTSLTGGGGGTKLLTDQFLGPFLLFVLLVSARDRPRMLVAFSRVLLGIVAAQCLLALTQSILREQLVFTSDFEVNHWFHPDSLSRFMGTTDSPLVLAWIICLVAPLTLGLRSSLLRFVLLALFAVGALVTQSRSGLALLCAFLLVVIFRARASFWARVFSAFLIAVAGYIIAKSSLVVGTAGRFTEDAGSRQARADAYRYFLQHLADYLFTGEGLKASYLVSARAGLASSFESSVIMFAVDVGVLLTVLYFGMQVVLVARYGRTCVLPGAALGALIGITMQHISSSVAYSNCNGLYIWGVLALMVAFSRPRATREKEVAVLQRPRGLMSAHNR